LAVTRFSSSLEINGNLITERNGEASNGAVNIIDGPLFPDWVSNSITNRVTADNDLSTLLALVVLARLGERLASARELIFVAPINSAFDKLPEDSLTLLTSTN
jgi:uncharacterized surface protein with fasciclin (FAS1) repeats